MPEIEIRPAVVEELEVLERIDPSYQTSYAWQMDRAIETSQVNIRFREVRLPRPVQVEYPRPAASLQERAEGYPLMLAALLWGSPVGYLGLTTRPQAQSACAADLVVRADLRRQGIGSALLLAGLAWAGQQNIREYCLEVQSKNYPMIRLANKLGFEFCGYNDHYFTSQDIALFFRRFVK